MRKECSANEIAFERADDHDVEANFDGGMVSYDVGALLLERWITQSRSSHAFAIGAIRLMSCIRLKFWQACPHDDQRHGGALSAGSGRPTFQGAGAQPALGVRLCPCLALGRRGPCRLRHRRLRSADGRLAGEPDSSRDCCPRHAGAKRKCRERPEPLTSATPRLLS